MPIRPRRARRSTLSDAAILELLAGPGPRGSAFADHEERAVAAERLPEALEALNGVLRMRLEHAAARVRAGGQWPQVVYGWRGRY